MISQTKDQILDFLAKNGRTTAKKIIEHAGITPAAVFRHLAKLQTDGKIVKYGTPPKVFYGLKENTETIKKFDFDPEAERIINENFLKISTDGILQFGKDAFVAWCMNRGMDPIKTAVDYLMTIEKFGQYKADGLIDGTEKFRKTFTDNFPDKIFYLDFYSIERFGKTKLGELVLYAKQSQNQDLIKLVSKEIHDDILKLMKKQNIDAVGFVPPTMKREVQFMTEIEKRLALPVPTIKITKIKTPITVPQKTLSKLEERVMNARQSIILEEEKAYGNILLIDDAIGSGATLHEVAKQIKERQLCTGKIIGLGITGSFSGFEVIGEV